MQVAPRHITPLALRRFTSSSSPVARVKVSSLVVKRSANEGTVFHKCCMAAVRIAVRFSYLTVNAVLDASVATRRGSICCTCSAMRPDLRAFYSDVVVVNEGHGVELEDRVEAR
jgi:hypothetical protein